MYSLSPESFPLYSIPFSTGAVVGADGGGVAQASSTYLSFRYIQFN